MKINQLLYAYSCFDAPKLTDWSMENVALILKAYFTISFYRFISRALPMKMLASECYRSQAMIGQYWFRPWLGVVRQQTINCINVDPNLCRQMVSLGHNVLNTRILQPTILLCCRNIPGWRVLMPRLSASHAISNCAPEHLYLLSAEQRKKHMHCGCRDLPNCSDCTWELPFTISSAEKKWWCTLGQVIATLPGVLGYMCLENSIRESSNG